MSLQVWLLWEFFNSSFNHYSGRYIIIFGNNKYCVYISQDNVYAYYINPYAYHYNNAYAYHYNDAYAYHYNDACLAVLSSGHGA